MFPWFSLENTESFWPDSNRRPTHYECVALPTALQKLKMTDPGIEPGIEP